MCDEVTLRPRDTALMVWNLDDPSSRRPSDASTDSLDVSPGSDAALTQTYEAASRELFGQPPEEPAIEANVILIAHPENRALGTRFRLSPSESLEIGRSPSVEVSLPEVLSISRNHARLSHHGSRIVVEDLGSTNGTYVNDELIGGPTVLHSGDRFQVGAVHFKFLHERDVEHAYHQAIYSLVMRDGLTEVFNKRKFDEELARELPRALRYGRPLSLTLLDIDNFKQLNDTYGHLCGDHVLKQLARRVLDALRTEQIFARVGGEEFAILCPETPVTGAAVLAEKLRQSIAELQIDYAGFHLEVTCSFGVAQLVPPMTSGAELFEAADRALYRSKNEGRNRVTVNAGSKEPGER